MRDKGDTSPALAQDLVTQGLWSVHHSSFPKHRELQQSLLPVWSWAKGGKLFPRFLHTDQGMLMDTDMHSEELQPNQTSSSGHLSKCFQFHFQAPKH